MSEGNNWTCNVLLPTSSTRQSKTCRNFLWAWPLVLQLDHNYSISPICGKPVLLSAPSHYSEEEPGPEHRAELLEVFKLHQREMIPRTCQCWGVSRSYWQWGIILVSCLGSIYITGIEWRNNNLFSPSLTPKSQFQLLFFFFNNLQLFPPPTPNCFSCDEAKEVMAFLEFSEWSTLLLETQS